METMDRITFYFDVVSPYAYLAFERIPQVLAGLSYEVRYQPVFSGGLWAHFGQKGPAELEPQRAWTFRHVAWLARQHGLPIQMSALHPFNSLSLLRLALEVSPPDGLPNRWVCEQMFHHVWRSEDGAADPCEPQRLATLTARLVDSAVARGLAPAPTPSDRVTRALQRATELAISLGVFDVPHFEARGRLYFGLEGLELLGCAIQGDPWFSDGTWEAAAAPRSNQTRASTHDTNGRTRQADISRLDPTEPD
jgi:2-hydroxychromene-2-carboxylate isomerase